MTPHNEAKKGDYADTVLLPGDPLRAQWIAETFLDQPRCVNRLRGCFGYTGTWRGTPVSVQATGMGLPSVAIYVHELLHFHGSKTLIRVGTCGGLAEQVDIRSLVIAQSASGDSTANGQLFAPFEFAPSPDFGLLRRAADLAAASGVAHQVGPVVSSDVYYVADPLARYAALRAHGVIAVDMETAAIFTLAARFGARALSICTVSDNLVTGAETHMSERFGLFAPMVELALNVAAEDARLKDR